MSKNTKTLGQIAYKAYSESKINDINMTSFHPDVFNKYNIKDMYFLYGSKKKIAYGPVLTRKTSGWQRNKGINVMVGNFINGVYIATSYLTLDLVTFKKEMKRISKSELGMIVLASYE
jgi:hypothetical protein